MNDGAAGLAWVSLAIIVGSLVLGTLAVLGARLLRSGRDRRLDVVTTTVRPHLLALLAGEPAELPPWRGRRRRTFEGLARRNLTLVKGEAHAALVDALEVAGVLDRARRQAGSFGATRRCRGVELLGRAARAGDRSVVEACLQDRDPEVRIVAARALGRIGDPAAAPALIAAAASDRPVPLAIAGQSLAELGPGTTSLLEAALVGGPPLAQALAAEVLGLLQTPSAVGALLEAVGRGGEVQIRATRSLGRIGSPRAVPLLTDIVAHDPAWANRAVAARALGAIGDSSCVEVLARALDDERYEVAVNAGAALAQLGPRGQIQLAVVGAGDSPGARFARQAEARRHLRQARPVTPLPIPVT